MKLNYSIKSAIVRKILQIDIGWFALFLFIISVITIGSIGTINENNVAHKNFASCVANHPVNDCKFILEK